MRYHRGILVVAITLCLPAWAGESLFSRAYTTETVPADHFEIEQTIRNRSGRSFGKYTAFDFKSEFEYGITDKLQGAFYLNTGYLNASGAPDDNDPNGSTGFSRSGFFLTSIALEFIYRAMSPISDPIGLAFYLEPEVDLHDFHNGLKEYHSFANEFRVLLQKNLFDDQLILVYNLVFEIEYFRYGDRDTPFIGEFDWNNELGVSYRFAPGWYGGLELRNHNELGNFFSHDHSVFWAGPALHYATTNLWATLGVLYQVGGNPNGFDSSGSFLGDGAFLHSHERWETTLKLGIPF
jgi:hypothetical protein